MWKKTYRRGRTYTRVGVYRSPFESRLAEQMEKAGVPFEYEKTKLAYTIPAVTKTYHPDFTLENGVIIEAKGLWEAADRKKILLVLEQNPGIDLRIVFMRASTKIYPGSKTSYADFCEKHGIKWAEKVIPASWLKGKTS